MNFYDTDNISKFKSFIENSNISLLKNKNYCTGAIDIAFRNSLIS